MKYQFFGDTHGETHWKQLIDPECIQVFLGDYFSPYKLQTYEQCRDNLLEILKFKEEYPNTILLLGNHDREDLLGERYSRHDFEHEMEIWDLFEKNKDKFIIAVALGEYLITHAGVTKQWKEKRIPDANTPQEIAEAINRLWNIEKYSFFNFDNNSNYWDSYGESQQQGPLWARWDTLRKNNVFKGTPFKQIVGHTICKDFQYCPNKAEWNLICIDCMAFQPKSLILDINV